MFCVLKTKFKIAKIGLVHYHIKIQLHPIIHKITSSIVLKILTCVCSSLSFPDHTSAIKGQHVSKSHCGFTCLMIHIFNNINVLTHTAGFVSNSLYPISDVPKLPPIPGQDLDEEEEEDDDEVDDEERTAKQFSKKSGPKVTDPYAADETSFLYPILIAVAVFIPTLFCLCRL